MKNFTKAILSVAVISMAATSAQAQLRWDPTKWTNKTTNQKVEIVNGGKAVKAVPMANDNAHIRNAVKLHLSEDEPYLIVKIAVDHEFQIARNYSGFCFYHQFKRKDGAPLTDAESVKLHNMVFHNQYFYKTPGMQRLFIDDNDMFDPAVPFDVFVIDLNDPSYNILSNGDHDIYNYVDYVDYNDDYQLQSYISFDMCCWGRNGADKNVYLGTNSKGESHYGVTYEYIATAGMYDILDMDELVDPQLVKELIDNYKNGQSLIEVRPGEEDASVGSIINDEAAVKIRATRGGVRAPGAKAMSVYSISGAKVADVQGDKAELAAGFYIVRATDADGKTATAKVNVR